MDLSTLTPVFERPGPYASLTLEVGRGSEDAGQQLEARWTTARGQLEGRLPGAVLDEVEDRVSENVHAPGQVRRTLVVAGVDDDPHVALDDLQPGHTHWPEVVDLDELPDLSSWLGVADRGRPFVLVITDRTGADIQVHRGLSSPPEASSEVTGETFHLTKVAEGDWAQKQFQQTAENAWEANARLVADETRSVAGRLGIRTIVVAGEVRARAEVLRALGGGHPDDLVLEVESGGRGPGTSPDALWSEVRERLVTLDREADAEVAARLEEGRGRGEGTATGVDEVFSALEQNRVERLVLDLEALQDMTMDPERWPGLPLPDGARGAGRLPADRALVAAGALTASRLTLLPAGMAGGDGASALLRWS